MNKTARAYCIRPLTVAIMLIAFAAAMAQELPIVAVGAIGDEPPGKGALKGLSIQLTEAIARSDKYTAVNRSEAILKELGGEHGYARSGATAKYKELGQQLAVDYLCIIESASVMDEYMLSVMFVDVVTAEILPNMSSVVSSLSGINDLMAAAEELKDKILGNEALNKPKVIEQVFTDPRDGKNYKVMDIGGLTWFVQELNYGRDTYTMKDAKNACPRGWHLPTSSDWNVLKSAWTEDVRKIFTRTSTGSWISATTDRYVDVHDGGVFIKKWTKCACNFVYHYTGSIEISPIHACDCDGHIYNYVRCVKD